MILFISFAPIEFLGGAERWILNVAKYISHYDNIEIINVDNSIADLYSKIVLKRKFNIREKIIIKNYSLKFNKIYPQTFIPFTNGWKKISKTLISANKIYIKFEILEVFILFYFGGYKIFSKTVAGIHSPYVYKDEENLTNKFHNRLYKSLLIRNILARFMSIHVLNENDYKFFKNKFKLKKIKYIPNTISDFTYKTPLINLPTKNLNILFVGELSYRKGMDRVIQTAINAPKMYKFHIVGDGPYTNQVIKCSNDLVNFNHYGHLSRIRLERLYSKCSILFLPSRAESMSLAVLEALSKGLIIVDSNEAGLSMPKDIEYTCISNKPEEYLKIFTVIYKLKNIQQLRKKIQYYYQTNFSSKLIYERLKSELFLIN